jgi:hypothetical protein
MSQRDASLFVGGVANAAKSFTLFSAALKDALIVRVLRKVFIRIYDEIQA